MGARAGLVLCVLALNGCAATDSESVTPSPAERPSRPAAAVLLAELSGLT